MRILHLDGFSKDDSLAYISVVHSNSIEALSQLIEACTLYDFGHDISVKVFQLPYI